MFNKSENYDLHKLLSQVVERNIYVYDEQALSGQFTKRLVSLMQQIVRRNSLEGYLTDLFIPEDAFADVCSWFDVEDDYKFANVKVFGIDFHVLDEKYQELYLSEFKGSMAWGDLQIVLGVGEEKTILGSF